MARQYFGYAGHLGLYLRGVFPLVQDQQLEAIEDGDVIVVTWDDKRLTNKQVSQMITTHQADFVTPALEQPRERRPSEPSQPYVPYRVTEQTAYTSAYVRQPVERVPPCGPRHMFPRTDNGKPTGTTSYTDEYVWRDPLYRPKGERPSDEPRNPRSFEGETTYNTMYTPCVTNPPVAPGQRHNWPSPKAGDSKSKFEGISTYRDHYVPKPLSPYPKGHPDLFDDSTPPAVERPFQGESEYRSTYVAREILSPRVHLEPEMGKFCEQ